MRDLPNLNMLFFFPPRDLKCGHQPGYNYLSDLGMLTYHCVLKLDFLLQRLLVTSSKGVQNLRVNIHVEQPGEGTWLLHVSKTESGFGRDARSLHPL